MPSPSGIWTPPGAVAEEPFRPGKESRDLWGGNPWTVRSGDWQANDPSFTLFSRAAVNGAIPMDYPGSYMDTRGPTGVGFVRVQTSMFASGVSKQMTVSVRRDGVTIASQLHNTSMADSTTGTNMDDVFTIPAYPYGAHYEIWWQANTSGAGRNQYSAFRYMWVPSDRLRLESQPDRTILAKGNVSQSHPVLVHPDLHILRTRSGPHRRGSARLVWSLNATGVTKTGLRVRLFREASPWLPAATLFDNSPALIDSQTGLNYDSGTITLPPIPHQVAYRWSIDTNASTVYLNTANGNSGLVNNRRIHVSQGHITVPPFRSGGQ